VQDVQTGGEHAAQDDRPGATSAAASGCAASDKALAREAWHRNSPALCENAASAVLVLPFKGRARHAQPEYRRRLREAQVLLPHSEPLLTHKRYQVNRLGIGEVRVLKLQNGSVRFRVRLAPGAGEPEVDVQDGYVKLTVTPPPS
jgi:hypothetical protein